MLNTINPHMLILGRESRGLSQSELAERISVSQGKLSKAEKGEQSLPNDVFEKLCDTLDYPSTFFYQNTPSTPVSHYYYRKKVSIAQKVMVQIEAEIKIFRRNIDSLLDAIELPEFKFYTANPSEETPEEIAKKNRFILGVPRGPIDNLTLLLERNGILVIKTDLFHEKIDGLSTVSEKGAHIIFLNSRMPNDRQRFSLAHELGHLLMHFDTPSISESVEDEANRFASEFLLPAVELKNALRFLNFQKLGDLKRIWKVSMKALIATAKNLGTLTDDEYRNFQINYSKKAFNKNEPIPLAEEKPYTLNQMVKLHLEELEYSTEELAKTINLSTQEFISRFIEQDKPKLRIIRFA